eukprot:Pgem_evm1s1086
MKKFNSEISKISTNPGISSSSSADNLSNNNNNNNNNNNINNNNNSNNNNNKVKRGIGNKIKRESTSSLKKCLSDSDTSIVRQELAGFSTTDASINSHSKPKNIYVRSKKRISYMSKVKKYS